jgi:predicted amidohydrolase YtcJ
VIMDRVLKSNAVFTGLKDEPERLAIGIKDNLIQKVCSPEEMEPYISAKTDVRDYGDQLIMPGFFDGHEHAFLGGIFAKAVDLSGCASEQEAAQRVKDFADQHPELSWIIGTDWSSTEWKQPHHPRKETLDALLPNRPAYLIDVEGHSAWLNSAAIKLSGVADAQEFGPELVARDPDGSPTGYIAETSMLMVARLAFDMPMPVQEVIFDEFQRRTASLGITSVSNIQCYQGSDIDLGNIAIVKQFEQEGRLNVRFFFATGLTGNLERPRRLRQEYDSDKLRFSGLKHIVDGTATGWTALLLEPYADKPGFTGTSRILAEELARRVVDADREGFRVRMHACGDGSVRRALDCYELAQKRNGKRDSRHTIEHIEIIAKEDIGRFAKLGVVASMQPDHIGTCAKFADNPYFARLGERRAAETWPIRTILETGAHMQFGTDFPIYDNNPMLALYRGTTRVFDDGQPEGGWNPSEKVTMAQLLKGYTAGSAYGAFMEDHVGTLEAGKYADIVVLDHNLFALKDPHEILETAPVLTLMDGRIVYEK